MQTFTPAERRGALLIAALLALGAVHDLWRGSQPLPTPGTSPERAPGWPATKGGGAPGSDSTGAPPGGPSVALDRATTGELLDLNRSSAQELESLPGVGPVLARRIVDHRARHGPFGSLEELLGVRGIGPRLFSRIRPRVTVGPRTTPAGAPTVPTREAGG